MIDPKKYNISDPSDLRRKAEKTVSSKEAKHSKPLSPEEMQRTLHELSVHQIELEMQNEELLRTQAELNSTRERYFDLYESAPVGYFTVSEKGLILEANLTAATMMGVSRNALDKKPISRFIFKDDQDIYYRHRKQLFQAGEPLACELRMLKKDGTSFWARLAAAVVPGPQFAEKPSKPSDDTDRLCRIVISDITEHKFQEDERELTAHLIVLVNTPGDFRERMSALTASLQGWSGCEAVGIRLRAGNDYPYYETRGFSDEFIQGESHLCAYGRDGKILCDDAGNPVLECMCGNILSGRFDSSKPFFTAHGSFWTNSTSALLASTSESDRHARTRNRCNTEGYESMALIPLRAGNQVFGLLQFNDRSPDCFTLELIAHFERMADSLAIALSRHHAEEELRESESRYPTTFAAVADGLWEWHVPSGKAFFSAIYYSMLGYEDGEFPASYDSWRRLVHPDDIGRVEQGLRQGLESGNGFNIELRMKMKSGDWGWVCTRGKVVEKDADGKALRMVGTLSDITERKRTERRQVLLSEILGILNSPVVLPDILNGVLSAIKRETGFDAMGIRLKSGDDYPYFSQDGFFKDFLLAENTLVKRDNDGGVCRDAKGNIILECTCGLVISGKTDPANPLFTSGGSFWTNNSFPLLDLPSDQDPRIHPRNRCIHDGYASIALIPIRAGQEIVGLLQLNNREKDSFTLDMIRFLEGICASIGMSLMQRHAEENYRTLFNEMLDGFALHEIICDSEGNPADYRFLAVNPAFERMTGLKTGEIVGRTILEVMPDTERYWIETYGNVALTGEPAFFENYSSELGKYFEVTVFRPAPRQFACIFSDITARKQGEEGKARLEQKLLESQKMQAVGQLAGGISHDFNNLLSVINGYSQLLVRNSDLKPAAVQQVEEILRAGERAAGLTRQLLVFSRHQTMELKIIDLNTIVSGTNKMLRRIVRENIEMAIIEGPNLGRIKADPGQIEQVIMNLVVNASDSMPNGGSITIKTENVKFGGNERVPNQVIKSGLYVMLSVSDTGCGMDNDVKEHIFEPFFTTKDVGKGTGLGLAIIYGIVKQANAYIDVQSELGKGTRFQIYFPQVVEEVTAEEEWRSVASFPRGSETIMISEDEESIRLMLEDFLKSIGYTVLTACNGKEALELAESHKGKIHLLLTDIVMPGMNGFELAKRLKKALPEIKLLFMTGYIKPTSTQEMMKIKDNLIDKPVSIHALSIKLREILG